MCVHMLSWIAQKIDYFLVLDEETKQQCHVYLKVWKFYAL